MIGVFFFYMVCDEIVLFKILVIFDNVVNVIGKCWVWDFNYLSDNVYEVMM